MGPELRAALLQIKNNAEAPGAEIEHESKAPPLPFAKYRPETTCFRSLVEGGDTGSRQWRVSYEIHVGGPLGRMKLMTLALINIPDHRPTPQAAEIVASALEMGVADIQIIRKMPNGEAVLYYAVLQSDGGRALLRKWVVEEEDTIARRVGAGREPS